MLSVGVLFLERLFEVVSGRGGRWSDEIIDIAPLLSPDVAEEIGGNHAIGPVGHRAIFGDKAVAYIGM